MLRNKAADIATGRLVWKGLRDALRALAKPWGNPVSLDADLHSSACAVPGTVGADTDEKQIKADVAEALAELPEHYREALRLKFWHDLKQGEIARILGTTVHQVNNWIDRGKFAMAAKLGAAGIEYLDVLEGRRNGAVYGDGEYAFDVLVEGADGNAARMTVETNGFAWHANGSVRAVLAVPANWPTLACGVLLSAPARNARNADEPLISAPFLLQPKDGKVFVEAFLGEPPPHTVARGPLELPIAGVTLLIAH